MEIAQSYEYSIYHSLQLNVTRRVSRGLTLLTNLVWSRVIDNNSSAAEGSSGPPNPFNLRSARGPADFDQAIRYNASINYLFPRATVGKVLGAFINGWQVNAIVSIDSGRPFTIVSGTDRSLSGIGNDYADQIGNPARPAGVDEIKEYFNTAAFRAAAPGTFGNVGRNSLFGPGYADVDSSIFKDLFQERRIHAQFRAEAFNTLNHVNFDNPNSNVSSGTFGQITGAGSPRVIQFGLKLMF